MNKLLELTLLTKEQVLDKDSSQYLKIFTKLTNIATISDLAILTGGENDFLFHYNDNIMPMYPDYLKGRSTTFYTQDLQEDCGVVYCCDYYGESTVYSPICQTPCIRPVLKAPIVFEDISKNKVGEYNGVLEVEFGEYPQYAAPKNIQDKLNFEFKNRNLIFTKRTYTVDYTRVFSFSGDLMATCKEYEYCGKKYIRFVTNYSDNYSKRLSNDQEYENGETVWIEVSPVKWLVDFDTKLLVSRFCLLSGIKYQNISPKYNGNFETSFIKEFLDNYMLKDLFQTEMLFKNADLFQYYEMVNNPKIESGEHLTLLTTSQVAGSDQLEVLKKYGISATISDLAILTGGNFKDRSYLMQSDGRCEKGQKGWFYTQTVNIFGDIAFFDDTKKSYFNSCASNGAIRPVLMNPSNFSEICSKKVEGYNGTFEVEYGEYPQYTPVEYIQKELELMYKFGKLRKTGRTYTFNSVGGDDLKDYQTITYDEYENGYGNKYIRIKANSNGNSYLQMSTGEDYHPGDYVWIEVLPVKWLIDEKTKTLVSKIGLVSGINFYSTEKNYNGDFETTDMKQYLDNYMIKDLFQTKTLFKDADLFQYCEMVNNPKIESGEQLTLLTASQVAGSDQLEVLKKYGISATISDLAILTGGYFKDKDYYAQSDGRCEKGRKGWFYTQTVDNFGNVVRFDYQQKRTNFSSCVRDGAIRPVLINPSNFSEICSKKVMGYNGTFEVEYGEYPQYVPVKYIQEQLESFYMLGMLRKTGKTYTFDSIAPDDYLKDYQPITYDEYENGYRNKYIRIKANANGKSYLQMSTGEYYHPGDYVWIEVLPVKWLIDEKTKTLVSKIGLVSGIKFYPIWKKYNGDFETTDMKQYLDNYMLKDLFQSQILTRNVDNISEEKEKRKLKLP